jgi:hypothetical protein
MIGLLAAAAGGGTVFVALSSYADIKETLAYPARLAVCLLAEVASGLDSALQAKDAGGSGALPLPAKLAICLLAETASGLDCAVQVKDAGGSGAEQLPRKLHVSKLTRNVSEEHVREIFGHYGSITSCQLAIDERVQLSKGYAGTRLSRHMRQQQQQRRARHACTWDMQHLYCKSKMVWPGAMRCASSSSCYQSISDALCSCGCVLTWCLCLHCSSLIVLGSSCTSFA